MPYEPQSIYVRRYLGAWRPQCLSVGCDAAHPGHSWSVAGWLVLVSGLSRSLACWVPSEVMFPSWTNPIQFTEDLHVPGSVQNGPLCLSSLIFFFQAGNFSHHCKRFLSSPCHLAGAQWDFLKQESGHKGFNWALGKFCQKTVFCAARARGKKKLKTTLMK